MELSFHRVELAVDSVNTLFMTEYSRLKELEGEIPLKKFPVSNFYLVKTHELQLDWILDLNYKKNN